MMIWVIVSLVIAGLAYFYRNPRRQAPDEPGFVAPADGIVVAIEREMEPDFLGCEAVKVSTFMTVRDVHINRVPMDGEVVFKLRRGRRRDRVSGHDTPGENASYLIGLVDCDVQILVKQVAGPLARHIICWPRLGQWLERGQRFGLIVLGSRVDVFLPVGVKMAVSIGDRVTAGESILGRL